MPNHVIKYLLTHLYRGRFVYVHHQQST